MSAKLEKVLDLEKFSVRVSGKNYDIFPLKTRNLPRALKSVESLKELKTKGLLEFVTSNFDNAIEFISATSGIEQDALMDSEISELVEVIEKILELNKDTFFLIQKKIETWTGKKLSNTSLKKVTNSKA